MFGFFFFFFYFFFQAEDGIRDLTETGVQTCALPISVKFLDGSTTAPVTITSWSWNFGDGSPLNSIQNPIHIYATGGTYSVTLTVTNSDGCSSKIGRASCRERV